MKLVLHLIWALFFACAVLATVHSVRAAKRKEQLIFQWPRAQATVTGSVAGWANGAGRSSRSRRFYPTYQFTAPGGTFVGQSEVSFPRRPVSGALLEVAYNPANPNQSVQISSESKPNLGCFIPFFAVFSLFAFRFIGLLPIG
jgi:hypothetical protein